MIRTDQSSLGRLPEPASRDEVLRLRRIAGEQAWAREDGRHAKVVALLEAEFGPRETK
jgi:hypothetical protein